MPASSISRAARRALLSCVVASCLSAPCASAATSAPIPSAEQSLRDTLAADIAQAGGDDSALVLDTTSGQTLFSLAPNAPRLPASVEKLYTTTTALLKFGPDATFETSVLGVGTLSAAGVWLGTIYLRGGGDPTFGSAAFNDAAYGNGVGATVQQLAADVVAAGIHQIDGEVIGDESAFDALRGTPATGYSADLELEGELSALTYDDGFESAAEAALAPNPAQFAAQQLVYALRADGVKIRRGTPTATGITPADAKPIAQAQSPTLATLIALTNAPSDNFFAETLLKDIGAKFGGGGTTADGAAVVSSFIASQFGIDPRLDDGSGLSRYDRTTATQVLSLLIAMQSNQSFTSSLAIAGISGTMQDEMLGTRADDNCHGKTGTLRDVANLVGYCTARNGDSIVFAFLLNGQSDSTYGHEMEDQMGVALANYDPLAASPSSTTLAPQSSSAGAPL